MRKLYKTVTNAIKTAAVKLIKLLTVMQLLATVYREEFIQLLELNIEHYINNRLFMPIEILETKINKRKWL